MKTFENHEYEEPSYSLFNDNQYSDASEVYDTERHEKLIVVERGINDEQIFQQEYLQNLGLDTLECIASDYDSLLFRVPEGARTIGASMQAFNQNVNKIEQLDLYAKNMYLPFFELGRQLSKLANANLRFKSKDTVIEKFATIPDANSQYGIKIAILPPYELQNRPNLHITLAKIIQEISKVNIDTNTKEIMLDSLLAGYLEN